MFAEDMEWTVENAEAINQCGPEALNVLANLFMSASKAPVATAGQHKCSAPSGQLIGCVRSHRSTMSQVQRTDRMHRGRHGRHPALTYDNSASVSARP